MEDGRRRVNLKLPDDLHRRVHVVAAEQGVTVQHFIESTLRERVERKSKDRHSK